MRHRHHVLKLLSHYHANYPGLLTLKETTTAHYLLLFLNFSPALHQAHRYSLFTNDKRDTGVGRLGRTNIHLSSCVDKTFRKALQCEEE